MRVTPLVWISFGLVSLTISAMLAGDWVVGLVPNHDRQVFEYRRDLAESLAVQYSALAERDQIETVTFAMETLAKRNPGILSLALLQESGTVVAQVGEELHALAPETDVGYLHAGQSARFIPQGPDRPSLEAQVAEIRDIDESSFTVPYLLSVYGGDVPVREDAHRRLKPETSVYRVTLHLVESPPRWNQAVRGTVLVKGPRISFAQRVWEKSARIFIRESGA